MSWAISGSAWQSATMRWTSQAAQVGGCSTISRSRHWCGSLNAFFAWSKEARNSPSADTQAFVNSGRKRVGCSCGFPARSYGLENGESNSARQFCRLQFKLSSRRPYQQLMRAELNPNWKSMPVGYHSRTGTIVGTDQPIFRPKGQILTGKGLFMRRHGRSTSSWRWDLSLAAPRIVAGR
jgi:hypothetical protein